MKYHPDSPLGKLAEHLRTTQATIANLVAQQRDLRARLYPTVAHGGQAGLPIPPVENVIQRLSPRASIKEAAQHALNVGAHEALLEATEEELTIQTRLRLKLSKSLKAMRKELQEMTALTVEPFVDPAGSPARDPVADRLKRKAAALRVLELAGDPGQVDKAATTVRALQADEGQRLLEEYVTAPDHEDAIWDSPDGRKERLALALEKGAIPE